MTELPRLDRTISSVSTLAKQGGDLRVLEATPAECLNMVWPLTLAAWSFKDRNVAQSRLQRHAVRVARRGN